MIIWQQGLPRIKCELVSFVNDTPYCCSGIAHYVRGWQWLSLQRSEHLYEVARCRLFLICIMQLLFAAARIYIYCLICKHVNIHNRILTSSYGAFYIYILNCINTFIQLNASSRIKSCQVYIKIFDLLMFISIKYDEVIMRLSVTS